MTRLPALLLLAALAAPAIAKPRLTSEQQLQKALDGLVAEKPTSCIQLYPSNGSTTYEGAVLYRVGSKRYLNRFGDGCPFLHPDDGLITRSFGSQLCRGDIVTIFTPGIPIQRGSCVMGDFTPYRSAKVK